MDGPLAARAQQGERMRRIGVLMNASSDDADGQARIVAFVQALQELGWTDRRNARIDIRWGAGDAERYHRYAVELVALEPDVILAPTGGVVATLQRTTRTVPIVFTSVTDPVGAGFVANLARPGGNMTGFAAFEYGLSGKWLALLKEIAPDIRRAAVLRDPAIAAGTDSWRRSRRWLPHLGVNPRGLNEEGWSQGRYGVYHDLDAWRRYMSVAGFVELNHYYRPAGLPRERQPWLASVWRR